MQVSKIIILEMVYIIDIFINLKFIHPPNHFLNPYFPFQGNDGTGA